MTSGLEVYVAKGARRARKLRTRNEQYAAGENIQIFLVTLV